MTYVVLAFAGGLLLLVSLAAGGYLLARGADAESRALAKRITRLPWRGKLRLVKWLITDSSIPLWIRGIPPVLVLYLASPIDIIPDFIPIVGQLDDVIVIIVGVGLLLRLVPRAILIDAVVREEKRVAVNTGTGSREE